MEGFPVQTKSVGDQTHASCQTLGDVNESDIIDRQRGKTFKLFSAISTPLGLPPNLPKEFEQKKTPDKEQQKDAQDDFEITIDFRTNGRSISAQKFSL
jgi:hypothetical protein